MTGFYLHVLYNEVIIIKFFLKNMSTMHQKIIAITILFVKLMLILKSSFHLYHSTKYSQEACEDSVIPILQVGKQRQADLPEADTNPAQLAWSTGWRCGTQGPVSSAPCPCLVPRSLPGRAAPSLGCKVGRERLYHNLSLFPWKPTQSTMLCTLNYGFLSGFLEQHSPSQLFIPSVV